MPHVGHLQTEALRLEIHLPWVPKPGSDDTGIRTLPVGLQSLCSARRHQHPTPTGLRAESKGLRRRGWSPDGSRRQSFRTDTLGGIPQVPGPGSKAGELSGGGGLKPGQVHTSDWGSGGSGARGVRIARFSLCSSRWSPGPTSGPRTAPPGRVHRAHLQAQLRLHVRGPLRRDPEVDLETLARPPASSGLFRVAAGRGARLPWKPRLWRRPSMWPAASARVRSGRAL